MSNEPACPYCGHRIVNASDLRCTHCGQYFPLDQTAVAEPVYRLVALNEHTERQSDQLGEYADLRALADYCNSGAGPDCRYDVVFADDALNADVLAEIAALSGADVAGLA